MAASGGGRLPDLQLRRYGRPDFEICRTMRWTKQREAGHAWLGHSGGQPNQGADDSAVGDSGGGVEIGRLWTKEEEERAEENFFFFKFFFAGINAPTESTLKSLPHRRSTSTRHNQQAPVRAITRNPWKHAHKEEASFREAIPKLPIQPLDRPPNQSPQKKKNRSECTATNGGRGSDVVHGGKRSRATRCRVRQSFH